MQRSENKSKSILAEKIKNRSDIVANENNATNVASLRLQLSDLKDKLEATDEADEKSLHEIEQELENFDKAVLNAKKKPVESPPPAPPPSPASDSDEEEDSEFEGNDQVEEIVDSLQSRYYNATDYYLGFSKIVLCSASDRIENLAKCEQDVTAFHKILTKIKTELDNSIQDAYQNNAALAKHGRELANALTRKLEAAKKNLADAKLEQKDFGYYNNREESEDQGVFVASLDEAKKRMTDYFKRDSQDKDAFTFEIQNGGEEGLANRPLNKIEKKEANDISFIPSVIKDDKNATTRFATIQVHDEARKAFKSFICFQNAPKNIQPITMKTGLFRSIRIPGRELMMFAHDVVENHRMMNRFYPNTTLKFNFSTAPSELAEAVVLYCKHKKYNFVVNGVKNLDPTPAQLHLLQTKLADELKDISPNALVASNPDLIRHGLQEAMSHRRAGMR